MAAAPPSRMALTMFVPPERQTLLHRLEGVKDAAESFGLRRVRFHVFAVSQQQDTAGSSSSSSSSSGGATTAAAAFSSKSSSSASLITSNVPAGYKVLKVKRLHCMRHGQGAHNVYRDESLAAGGNGRLSVAAAAQHPRRDELWDPLLTATGKREAQAAQTCTMQLQPELIVVSPLRRATQTARLAFERQCASV
jgi:hypothetical protein